MIYITGDCHGDYTRLFNLSLTEKDYLLICGDFSILLEKNEHDIEVLNQLDQLPYTILFIDGNHENFDVLDTYPISLWNKGKVHFITPSIIHLMRGQVFCIEGKTFFTFGGAKSNKEIILEQEDPLYKEKRRNCILTRIPFGVNHVTWWKQELPNSLEYEEGISNLEKYNWKVDYVVTHCACTSIQNKIDSTIKPNELTEYLEQIYTKSDYKGWYFGHYHIDSSITNKDEVIYQNIEKLRGSI